MAHHDLKIWPDHFKPVVAGQKRAEFRRDDRTPRFQTGDTLLLREYERNPPRYTGRSALRVVTHVSRGDAIPDGFAVLSMADPDARPVGC